MIKLLAKKTFASGDICLKKFTDETGRVIAYDVQSPSWMRGFAPTEFTQARDFFYMLVGQAVYKDYIDPFGGKKVKG